MMIPQPISRRDECEFYISPNLESLGSQEMKNVSSDSVQHTLTDGEVKQYLACHWDPRAQLVP